MTDPWRPTREQLQAAFGTTIRDVIADGLDILFCGINPGLYSGAVGHHFARPGNRFWPTLHRAGFTPVQLSPFDERDLLPLGLGITNVVARTTATAAELSHDELRIGAAKLIAKVRRRRPRWLVLLGITTYRIAFEAKAAIVGLQDRTIGETRIWVLPNPSGLNAHYQLPELVKEFRKLRRATGAAP